MTLGNAIKVKSGLGGPAGLWQKGDSPGRRSLTRVCHIERWWHRGLGGGGDALCDKGVPKGSATGVSAVPVWVWGLSQRGGSEKGSICVPWERFPCQGCSSQELLEMKM